MVRNGHCHDKIIHFAEVIILVIQNRLFHISHCSIHQLLRVSSAQHLRQMLTLSAMGDGQGMFCSQKNGLNFSVPICQFPLSSFELCKLLLDFAWYSSCKTFRQWLILVCTSYVVNEKCSKENWLYFLMRCRHHSEHELELVQHLLNGAASWLNKNQLACLLPFQIYAEEQRMILASCLLFANVEEDTYRSQEPTALSGGTEKIPASLTGTLKITFLTFLVFFSSQKSFSR